MSTVNTNQITCPFFGIENGVVNGICKKAKEIHRDVSALGKVIAIVGKLFILFAPVGYLKLRANIAIIDPYVDSVQTASTVHALVNKPRKEDNAQLTKLADVAFLSAGAGTAVQLTDTVGLIALPTIASSAGSFGLLGMVTKSVVGTVVLGSLSAAFVFVGLNAFLKLNDANREMKIENLSQASYEKSYHKKNQAMIDIAWAVSEVAFFVLAITAAAPTVALYVGLTASSLGVVSFLHSLHRKAVEDKLNKQHSII